MQSDKPPTAEMALNAIRTLFHDPDGPRKESANKWLNQLRRSVHLWEIADQILRLQRDAVSCHFAANAMRHHVQTAFKAESPELQNRMRDNLIFHASQVTLEYDHTVVIQLSLALADMVLLMPDWERPLETLLRKLALEKDAPWALVETLRLIPEELDSKNIRFGSKRRQSVYVHLDLFSPRVSEFLSGILQRTDAYDGRLLNGVLKCYSAWMACHCMSFEDFPAHPVAQKMLQVIRDVHVSQRIHDTCAQCMITVVSNIEDREASSPETKLRIFKTVQSFEATCYECVRANELEKIENFCRIFTALGEAFLPYMTIVISQPHFAVKSLDWVVSCMSHVEFDVAVGTFHLWSRLTEELFKRQSPTLTNYFKPTYEKLLIVLLKLVQIPTGHVGPLDPQGALIEFRSKAQRVLKSVAYILGSSFCFRKICEFLLLPGASWELMEASLFILQHVSRTITPDDQLVSKVVSGVLGLQPNTPVLLRHTSIRLLGVLGVWLNGNSETFLSVLNHLLHSMSQPGLADAAVMALTTICLKCSEYMTHHLDGLMHIVSNLERIDVSKDVSLELLKGITTVLTLLPRDEIDAPLHQLMMFQLQPLAQIAEHNPVDYGRKGGSNDPARWLDRASAIIQKLKPNLIQNETHPAVALVQEAWPLFSLLYQKYQADGRIIERVCRFMRCVVRVVRKEAEAFLENLVNKMLEIYAVQPHSCILNLAALLADVFNNVGKYAMGLLYMLKSFMPPTFAILNAQDGVKNNPDTVDDFFRLCTRIVAGNPLNFLQSDVVVPIVQCGMMACLAEHRDAISSVLKFFSSLLVWGFSTNTRKADCIPLVQQIVRHHGDMLVSNLLQVSAYSLHHCTMNDVAHLLLELREVTTHEVFDTHLRAALAHLESHNSRGSDAVDPAQLAEFCVGVVHAGSPKVMRGYLRMLKQLYR